MVLCLRGYFSKTKAESLFSVIQIYSHPLMWSGPSEHVGEVFWTHTARKPSLKTSSSSCKLHRKLCMKSNLEVQLWNLSACGPWWSQEWPHLGMESSLSQPWLKWVCRVYIRVDFPAWKDNWFCQDCSVAFCKFCPILHMFERFTFNI